ncbi:hypothetical protein XW81_01570 [Buchnera aphidicola (Schlechtendalia chinensis)]|uniref:Flagellar basal-body rod protein FlgF n=1 Tax=Buchnera aphidicola subsp. Schlechtendalia chinensis TaxID=118110 RepID=A0A172WDN2_BUCSC|nr:flagellar basal body rod C-terminal domain-containing protein [Buchnera aphidicola]ANF17088.1 hypothetical protein XW81_01570 [Buchnera aphidicola (Schlechtendalia chinensis)]
MKPLTQIIMMSSRRLLDNQEILANNISNASTTGFKAKLLSRNVILENRNDKESNYLPEMTYDQTQGLFRNTSRPLDFSIKDKDGWLAVQVNNNEIAYTKNGHLQINKNQQICSQNNVVIGENGPITVPDYSDIKILSDGTISISNNDKNFDQKIDKIRLVRIDSKNLKYSNNGLYFLKDKNQINSELKNNDNINILPETLEDSNVNLPESIVDMISDSRMFDIYMKILMHRDESLQLINKFLNVNN